MMLLLAAHVVRLFTYAGLFAAEFGSLGFGAPTNVTPIPVRHDWKEPSALNSAVVGSCLARGIVAPVEPAPPLPPNAPAGMSARGICPDSTMAGVDDEVETPPHPAATVA